MLTFFILGLDTYLQVCEVAKIASLFDLRIDFFTIL